jgi:hypothetical protein
MKPEAYLREHAVRRRAAAVVGETAIEGA